MTSQLGTGILKSFSIWEIMRVFYGLAKRGIVKAEVDNYSRLQREGGPVGLRLRKDSCHRGGGVR